MAKKKNRGGHIYMYNRTGWATRLRKRGKKEDSRGTCEGTCTGWATRLRKRGKKKKIQGERVKGHVLGGLLG